MKLIDALSEWDEKSKTQIKQIYSQYCDDPMFLKNLINALKSTKLTAGASWLLKHHLESGARLNYGEEKRILRMLPKLENWQSELHLLQILPYFTESLDIITLKHYLITRLSHDNKFIRAWTYNGIFLLAEQNPEFRPEANKYFALAMQDEPASVKARLRQCFKKSNWAGP
jgi:hypothetical protein